MDFVRIRNRNSRIGIFGARAPAGFVFRFRVEGFSGFEVFGLSAP